MDPADILSMVREYIKETYLEEHMKSTADRLMELGKEIGEVRGEEKKARETAIRFLKMGFAVETVAEGTELPVAEVRRLAAESTTEEDGRPEGR